MLLMSGFRGMSGGFGYCRECRWLCFWLSCCRDPGWCVTGSAAAGIPVGVSLAQLLPGVPVVHHHLCRRQVHLLLLGCPGPGVSKVLQVAGAQGWRPPLLPRGLPGRPVQWVTEGCNESSRFRGRRCEICEIRGGRLRAKVRSPISASMMKGPEALGASGCLGRSWFWGCFAALTSTRSPTWNRCALTCLLEKSPGLAGWRW